MTRYSFERACIAINNRLGDGYPKGKTEREIYNRVYQPGLITRNYYGKPIAYCSECGSRVGVTTQKECPVCHAKWKAAPMPDLNRREVEYHMVFQAKGDIQLTRIYRVERHTQYGKAAMKCVWEVERIMYAPTGERRVFTRGVQSMTWYYDAFSRGSSITMKRESINMSYRATHRYNLVMDCYYIESLTQQWRYKDIKSWMADYKNDTSVLKVLAYPWAETMIKTGQKKLFRYLVAEYMIFPKDMRHALNICTRNHYKIDDPSIWLDHLNLLKHFKLDTHNAHYVCPKDLNREHQILLERKRRDDERRETKLKLERMEKQRVAYQKRWAKVLPLVLTGNNLNVKPLQSVDEFAEEGNAMHHCVFAMGYYDRANSLILSAKDDKGNRLATIEYNTLSKEIVQCRAACNEIPKRDAEIRALITSHRKDFAKLLKAA